MSKYTFKCPCCQKLIFFDNLTNEAVFLDPSMEEEEKRKRDLAYEGVNHRMQAQMKALIDAEEESPFPRNHPMGNNPFFR